MGKEKLKGMNKILVANRGEIALRIMKTIKRMGIGTVAVYSEADRNAPHVRFADEAVLIGGAASSDSYLQGDRIIRAAKETRAHGIHPGYGFLSENADFAEKVEQQGLTWIGPGSRAIRIMGSKLAAKEAVRDFGIPMVPGTDHAVSEIGEATRIAEQVGFPILIKASAGGGGKGMRIVREKGELEEQMTRAVSEATSAFGDGAVFIEKYVENPRHIEVQVLADTQGHIIHLFERECSIQRRHQKVLEEAPSVVLDTALRNKMGEAAIAVARACDYVGAGTVEFLLDSNKEFYFLEMNTRLQVEHPVTECITGIDLVEQQIRIARGEPIPFSSQDLQIKGHALELRVYAEDPSEDFLPSVGTLEVYRGPTGPGIRLDDGYVEGMEVPIHYDPMLAKLITYGETRAEAIEAMIQAIDHFEVKGLKTTLPFGKYVCMHPAFRSGDFDTNFVREHFSADALKAHRREEARIAALVGLRQYLEDREVLRIPRH